MNSKIGIEDEIDELAEEYCDKQEDEEGEIEKRLLDSLPGSSVLERSDIESVMEWKLMSQGGRASTNISSLEDVSDGDIRAVTEAALTTEDLKTQINILRALPGVGVGVATSVLGFVDPEQRVVADINVYNYVFDEDVDSVTVNRAVDLNEKLQQMFAETEYSLRQVDRALFVESGGFED